jgi:hypothetical protein
VWVSRGSRKRPARKFSPGLMEKTSTTMPERFPFVKRGRFDMAQDHRIALAVFDKFFALWMKK